MKVPDRLIPHLNIGQIQEVLGRLQSGKEADVYLVVRDGKVCCAKVYKEANNRTFKAKAQYTEGRKSRDSRQARAMSKNSKFGRQERESEWQNTEVEALYRLAEANVRVPKPLSFYEGVLLLEMVVDADDGPAPRLNDVDLTAEQARTYHQFMIRQVVMMLCAGIVHGDLSEFNILVAKDGLVIIDLPQAVQSTANNAYRIFERDLTQLAAFFGRAAPEILQTSYAKEIWKLYESGKLLPESPLTGRVAESTRKVNVGAVLDEIGDAREEAFDKRGPRKV